MILASEHLNVQPRRDRGYRMIEYEQAPEGGPNFCIVADGSLSVPTTCLLLGGSSTS